MVGTNVSDRRGPWPFTDCVLIGTDGRGTGAYASAKALSTKDDPVDGVMAGEAGRQRRPFGEAAARTNVAVRARHDDRHQRGAGALGGPGRARRVRWLRARATRLDQIDLEREHI